MIRTATALLTLQILCSLAPTPAGAQGEARIESLEWLTGCWRSEKAAELSEECWLSPRATAMVGVNRTSKEDRYAFEFLRIAQDEEGITYWASPSGKPAVPFRASEISDRRVVFANPEHDFPQRITYWREGDRLHARVEAESSGEWKGFDLVWELSEGGWSAAPGRSDD